MKTRESLGIFWEGSEVDGVLIYGLWLGAEPANPGLPEATWPEDARVRARRLSGEGWVVWMWEVQLRSWPSSGKWSSVVDQTLGALVSAGAVVAWCGVEGSFVDPPGLFDPEKMSDGVWACLSRGGTSWHAPSLEDEFGYLSKECLLSLRKEVALS